MRKKVLVVGIIFLFIGASVYPAIAFKLNTNINENKFFDNELIEINIQIIKCNKIENHVVSLTKEKADELDILINKVKDELFNAKSLDETAKIHCDMITALNEIGILPEYIDNKSSILSDIYGYDPRVTKLNDFKNVLKYNTIFPTKINTYEFLPSSTLYNLFCYVSFAATLTAFSKFFYRVGFGGWFFFIHGDSYEFPADGWINTNGYLGIKNYEGKFYGGIRSLIKIYAGDEFPNVIMSHYYVGIILFSGFNIIRSGLPSFSQGKALIVKLL